MRIFAWTGTQYESGVGTLRYRITTPLREAEHQGLARWRFGANMFPDVAMVHDVLVGQLLIQDEAADIWETLSKVDHGPLLVTEFDDDLVNIRDDNPFFSQIGMSHERFLTQSVPAAKRALAVSDLVTVSVPHLAAQFREHTDAPIVVLPNTVDEVLLEIPQRPRAKGERLRVGWSGSATHDIDMRQNADGIRYGLRRTGAQLVLMGADYRPLLRQQDTEFYTWQKKIEDYYTVVSTFHVALAPLADDMFNRSKSPLKALEASAMGIPVVASDAGPYRDFVKHGETGFLCRTDDDWMRAIRALDADEELRLAMGLAARAHASTFTTQRRAPDWIETYRQALIRKHGPDWAPLQIPAAEDLETTQLVGT